LLTTPILLPPIAEQQRIVDVVSSLDRLSGVAHRLTSAHRDLARHIRAEHFATLAGEPVPAGEFFEIAMGRQRSPKNASGEHMVPYLRAANVKDGWLNLSDVKRMNFTPTEQARFRLREGDVLVTEGCGSLRQLGASARWPGGVADTVCFQNTLLRIRARSGISMPEYAHQWARYSFESSSFARIASGTNIFHLGADRASAISMIRVSLDEQAGFVRRAEAADVAADSARLYSDRLDALRVALLNDLLSGSHTIPDSYDRLLGAAG
jgi:type I restriction enzyme S subunit